MNARIAQLVSGRMQCMYKRGSSLLRRLNMCSLATAKLQKLLRVSDEIVQAEGRLSLEARVVWKEYSSVFIPTMRDFLGRRLHLLPKDVHREVARLVVCALQGVELLFKNDIKAAVSFIDSAKTIYMDTSGQLNRIEVCRMSRLASRSPTRRCRLVSNSRCRKRHSGRKSERIGKG